MFYFFYLFGKLEVNKYNNVFGIYYTVIFYYINKRYIKQSYDYYSYLWNK